MHDWPPITDPRVRDWLGLDQAAWLAALPERFAGLPKREFGEAAMAHALGYPWERPAGSYLLRDGEVMPLEDVAPDDRRLLVDDAREGRYPLVAFGANGAPTRLIERVAHFDDPRDRVVLVLTGKLHEVDAGAQIAPTGYGSVPAALIASPGTAIRAAVLFVTAPVLAEITWWEIGYRLGRLDQARFTMDEADVAVEDLFAFVSRAGGLRIDGDPIALAAIPAEGRTARAMTQEELLDHYAVMTLGPDARARDLVRKCIGGMEEVIGRLLPQTAPTALHLPPEAFTPYPVG